MQSRRPELSTSYSISGVAVDLEWIRLTKFPTTWSVAWPLCDSCFLSSQEAQLLSCYRETARGASCHWIFAKSLKITQGHSKWHSWEARTSVSRIRFLRHSALNNGVTLKSGFGVVQGHWKWRRSIDHKCLSIWCPLYSSILYSSIRNMGLISLDHTIWQNSTPHSAWEGFYDYSARCLPPATHSSPWRITAIFELFDVE